MQPNIFKNNWKSTNKPGINANWSNSNFVPLIIWGLILLMVAPVSLLGQPLLIFYRVQKVEFINASFNSFENYLIFGHPNQNNFVVISFCYTWVDIKFAGVWIPEKMNRHSLSKFNLSRAWQTVYSYIVRYIWLDFSCGVVSF